MGLSRQEDALLGRARSLGALSDPSTKEGGGGKGRPLRGAPIWTCFPFPLETWTFFAGLFVFCFTDFFFLFLFFFFSFLKLRQAQPLAGDVRWRLSPGNEAEKRNASTLDQTGG